VLFRNTVAQSGSLLVGYLFSFLLAPLMLARLGLDKFGFWSVTGAFATYAGLLDLGIGRSIVRFIAIYDAEGRRDRIRQCLGLGLVATTLVGLAALVAVAAAAPLLSQQLGVLDAEQTRVVAMAAVGIWTLNGYQGVLNAVGLGRRQMVPPNVATTIALTVNFAISVAALLASTSLVVYALANVAAALIGILPSYVALRRIWPGPRWARPGRALTREVLGFSVKNQIGWLADLVNFQTDKVVIAFAVDVRAAAVYEIASRVVIGVRSAAVLTVSALMPTAAAKIVEGGRRVVGPMYRRYTLRSNAIAFPLFTLAAVTSPFLLVAWLGRAPGDSTLLIPVLTVAYMINTTTAVGSTIALSAGHPGLVSLNAVLIAVVNVALTVALAPLFGIWGVVGGTFLALLVGSVRFNARFLRLFDLSPGDFLRGVVPTAVLAVGLALPSIALAVLVGTPDGRLSAALLLALSLILYVPPYWWLATRGGYLPEKLRFPGVGSRQPVESP